MVRAGPGGPLWYSTALLCTLLIGCATQADQPGAAPAARPTEPPSAPLRYLALGDSYTIGEGVGAAERWPAQLVTLLRQEQIDMAEPVIVAETGWRTYELLDAIERAGLEGSFELVSLLIGVNNQYRGGDLAEYRSQFRQLLQQALRFAGDRPQRVLVLSIPDWSVTPFAVDRDRPRIQAEIELFNAVNREEAERAGVQYIDIGEIARRAATDQALIADDGLHPSGAMYAAWARQALPAARSALEPAAR